MTKYDPLRVYLAQVDENATESTLTFRQIEPILSAADPKGFLKPLGSGRKARSSL
jgi:hypothetical protein